MSTFLVIGDFMVDRYLLASAKRWSAEAPVPVWKVEEEFERPGGAGNVAENLTDMGESVYCLPRMPYPIKNRVIVDGKQVARFDVDDRCYPPDLKRLERWVNAEDVDGVVVSDYGKGAVDEIVQRIVLDANKLTFIDTKRNPEGWFPLGGNVWFFPNYAEFGEFEAAYRRASQVVLKRSGEGIARLHYGSIVESYPAYTSPSEVVDVCGAGDTVLAAFASHLLSRSPSRPACTPLRYANAAAAAVVRKPFTSTPHPQEIAHILTLHPLSSSNVT